MAQKAVSKQVLLDGAQMMTAAMVAGTMSFLKERKIPIKDWIGYIGDSFEGSFGNLEGAGVDEVMDHLLNLQLLPLGVEVVSSNATANKAEVTLTTLPPKAVLEKFGTTPKELLKGFGVTQKEFESIYAIQEPAVKAIGLRFTHQIKDGQEKLTIEKAPSRTAARPRR